MIYISHSAKDTGTQTRHALAGPLHEWSKSCFLQAWSSLAYLSPSPHPDGFEDVGSGWPRVLGRFSAEGWRRAEAGDLSDDEFYLGNAQWCGLYDRIIVHLPDERRRRVQQATAFGEPLHA